MSLEAGAQSGKKHLSLLCEQSHNQGTAVKISAQTSDHIKVKSAEKG